jgi:hypothetical protein
MFAKQTPFNTSGLCLGLFIVIIFSTLVLKNELYLVHNLTIAMSEFDTRAREWNKDIMHVERSVAIASELEKMIPLDILYFCW